jgi:hypothetical protein
MKLQSISGSTARSSVAGLEHNDQFQRSARLGYAARGAMYAIIGFFALLAAVGRGGETPDSKGALVKLLQQPFGDLLPGVVALGLIAYSAWRLLQALRDVDGHGTDAKGLAIRGGLIVSGISYAALALFAGTLLFGIGSGGGNSKQDWTAALMAQPFGQWLVAAVGLAVVGAGAAQMIKGRRRRYRRYLKAPASPMGWIDPVSRWGLIARGVVLLIIGGFFMIAAYQAQPSEAQGLAEALRTLQAQPYGSVLLGAVAAGLVAFSVYSFVEAAYRRIGKA